MHNTFKCEYGVLTITGRVKYHFLLVEGFGKIPLFCSCIHLTLALGVFVPPSAYPAFH